MTPMESALIGFPLIAAGIASFIWGVKQRLAWQRGEAPSPVAYASFRQAPSAPGGWQIAIGIALAFVGVLLLAPFVASI